MPRRSRAQAFASFARGRRGARRAWARLVLPDRRAAPAFAILALLTCAAPVVAQADTMRISLEEAHRIALETNPRVLAARAAADAALGARRQAGAYPYNPDFYVEGSTLIDPGGTDILETLLTQEIEWAGQWGLRKSVADYGVDAQEAMATDAARITMLDVDVAFYTAAAAARRAEVSSRGSAYSNSLLSAVRAQLDQGQVSPMDLNLAMIEAGRTAAGLRRAERDHQVALLRLKEFLGIDAGQPIALLDAPPPEPIAPNLDEDSIVTLALARRPDLRAANAGVDQAGASRRLAARSAVPNLRVSGALDRANGGEDRFGVRLGLVLPLWDRNRGNVDAASAQLMRARADQLGVERRVRTEVAAALIAWRSARDELEILEIQVLQPARENQDLLDTAYSAGRLDLPTTMLLRSQLLQAELDYWDAWLVERSARAQLTTATGGG